MLEPQLCTAIPSLDSRFTHLSANERMVCLTLGATSNDSRFVGNYIYFWDKVSLYSPGCPVTPSGPGWPQTHRDLPASASRVPGLKVCATTWHSFFLSTYLDFGFGLSGSCDHLFSRTLDSLGQWSHPWELHYQTRVTPLLQTSLWPVSDTSQVKFWAQPMGTR